LEYAQTIANSMQSQGIRVEVDTSGERLPKKIRNAEIQKIPVMAVIGAKEIESQSLSIRTRSQGDLGLLKSEDVLEKMKQAVENYSATI
jgi:threonyl-tRNA synthetase